MSLAKADKKIRLGLIGRNISHSKSAELYKKYYSNYSYELLDFNSESELPSLNELSKKYDGLNITAPYKNYYFGAEKPVNTLKFKGCKANYSSTLTDKEAFESLWLNDFAKEVYKNNLKLVLIGDGVMGKMVSSSLGAIEEKKIDLIWFSRKMNNLNSESFKHLGACLIINTCSRDFVFSYDLNPRSIFWDFNYDFIEHSHIKDKCQYIDGLSLLHLQAYYATKFWDFD